MYAVKSCTLALGKEGLSQTSQNVVLCLEARWMGSIREQLSLSHNQEAIPGSPEVIVEIEHHMRQTRYSMQDTNFENQHFNQ